MFLDLALKNLLHFIVIQKHIEMYNHPVNKIYFLLNTEKTPFFPNIPPTHLFFLGVPFHFSYRWSILLLLYVKWDQKDEMDIKILDFNRGDNDVENKTRILYNDTVDQWKGCSAAW